MSGDLLKVEGLKVHFRVRGGVLRDRSHDVVRAVDGVSFEVRTGETLGLVGESGCGKSTTGRAVMRLLEPTAGSIVFDGEDISHVRERDLRRVRRRLQMVFQDPFSSLDPRMKVEAIVAEPLRIHDAGTRIERRERVQEVLHEVGLDASHGSRYPHEFSGGQRQRVAVARALALSPDLIVADEPVSALDLSIQAQIVNLLERLQDKLGISYVFIAHDLAVVEHVSHRIGVMYLGRMMEMAPSRALRTRPLHPYSVALWSAVPVTDPRIEATRERIILRGDVPSPVHPPSGCPFHTRCWLRQRLGNPEVCSEVEPPLVEVEANRAVACHLVEEVDGSREQQQVARATTSPAPVRQITA